VLTTFSSNWVEDFTGYAISDREEQEGRYDPLSNLRGVCQRCSCRGFVAQCSLEASNLEQCTCRRCGCPCTRHVLLEEFLAKPAPSSRLKITTCTWSIEDLKPGEDAVGFVIARLEAAENLYETLGVPHTATAQEVRRAFRSISLRLHPDKLVSRATREPELVEKAEIFFKLLSAANEVLSDERQRRDYDAQWKAELQRLHKDELKAQMAQQQQEQREKAMREHREMSAQEEQEPDFGLGGELGQDLFRKGGIFGQSGLYKEHANGGFTWQFPGGGTITVDNSQNFANRAYMSEKMPWEWMAQGKELYTHSGMAPGAGGPPSSFAPGVPPKASMQTSAFDAPYRRFET